MSNLIDLTNYQFFRLTVLYRSKDKVYNCKNKKVSKVTWHCKCQCGNEVDVLGESLRQGLTKSCGCWDIECKLNPEIKHHSSNTSDHKKHSEYHWLYERYRGILRRCGYCSNQMNKYYYQKGIKVDPIWLNNYNEFKKWALNNGARKDLTIDRIDVNKDYTPSNCRWVNNKIQQRNKTNNRLIEYEGKLISLAELADINNMNYRLLRDRLNAGWDLKRALNKN